MAFDINSAPQAAKQQITVQIKGPTGSGLETFTDAGCIVNDVNLGRSWANDADTGGETRWCDSGEEVARLADYIAGEETITSSILIEGVLSDPAYQFLAQNRRTPFDMRFVMEDGLTPKTTQTMEYKVVKTADSFNMRGQRGQTMQYSFDFQAIEVIDEEIETAS